MDAGVSSYCGEPSRHVPPIHKGTSSLKPDSWPTSPKPMLTQITIYSQFGKPFLKVFAVSLVTLKGLQYSLTYLENEEKALAQ